MTRIKICGVTLPADAARIAATGVDFLGLNFWPGSKRYLAPDRAPEVAAAARARGASQLVGVFVDARVEDVLAVTAQVALDVVQLHGDEDPDRVRAIAAATGLPVWKAVAVAAEADVAALAAWPVAHVLLDTPSAGRGGSGATFDWSLAEHARRRHPALELVLAGGLAPDNVAAAIAQVAPWAVDVASGVEASPGVKDPAKVAAFVAAVRG